jgi:hypothetical protein
MPRCDNCTKEAIHGYPNGMKLCLDCSLRQQNAAAQQIKLLMQLQEGARADMDDMLGLPRRQPAPVVVQRGPMTFNNISVNKSVVGAINTGNVQSIDVAIRDIKQKGTPAAAEMAKALKEFTEATLQATDLEQTAKNDLVEQVAFLTDQLRTKSADRKTGMVSRTLTTIGTAASTSNALVALWPHLHHLFNLAFQIST